MEQNQQGGCEAGQSAASQLRQGCKVRLVDSHRLLVGDNVKNLLAFAPGIDQLFAAQHAQLQRKRGLLDVEQAKQFAYAMLILCKLVKQWQAVRVGQHF